ncbi:MAG TPA: hypothetical protein PLE19_13115 [Planctomycetota bacterium]|nr:hypothetical protein [Planctomycetota bacterium]HRR81112.1 hypothetical protein [Planctomycetota bacterium]HRT93488.1 hypothetical protein [Planctomycetota bacterium]
MKHVVFLSTLLVGAFLTLSPMIFHEAGPGCRDYLFYANLAGLGLLVCAVVMGFKALREK